MTMAILDRVGFDGQMFWDFNATPCHVTDIETPITARTPDRSPRTIEILGDREAPNEPSWDIIEALGRALGEVLAAEYFARNGAPAGRMDDSRSQHAQTDVRRLRQLTR